MEVGIVAGVALMALSWATRLFIRNGATTDPRKLAPGDLWVRAYLGRATAAGAASPDGPVSQAKGEPAAGVTLEAPGDLAGRPPS